MKQQCVCWRDMVVVQSKQKLQLLHDSMLDSITLADMQELSCMYLAHHELESIYCCYNYCYLLSMLVTEAFTSADLTAFLRHHTCGVCHSEGPPQQANHVLSGLTMRSMAPKIHMVLVQSHACLMAAFSASDHPWLLMSAQCCSISVAVKR